MHQSLQEAVKVVKAASIESLAANRQPTAADLEERRMGKRCNP